jgi:iron complex outermembrane receptor protein
MRTIVQTLRVRIGLLAGAGAACLLPCVAPAQTRTLAETRVTATRFADTERALPFGVSVLGADEIRASGAGNVNEAIMRLLGVVGRQDPFGGGEYQLDLRGFGVTSDNNQVVIVDGLRLSEADLGGTRLAGIPIESVERIEVLRGSGAVLYGEGATGGVIVITTKAGAGHERANAASLYGAAGSFNLREARASANVGGGGFSLDAHAQKRKTDGHRANFASSSDGQTLTGQWSGDWLRLGARLEQDDLATGLPGALTGAQYAADPHQSSKPNDHASIRNQRGALFANAELGGWQLAFEGGHRTKALRSLNSGFAYDYDIDSNSYALRGRRDASFGGWRNALTIGSDIDDWQRDLLGAFGSVARQRSRAFYAKDDLTLPGGTRLTLGARTARIDKDNSSSGSGFAARRNAWELGASHPFTRAFTGYVRVGRSFRLPSVDEFNFTTPGVALRPQSSRDAELGARWAYEGGQLEARLYRSVLHDEIGFDPNAVGPLSAFGSNGANVNFDPTRRQGLELEASRAVTRTVGVRLNAAWRQATFRSGPYAGRDVPLVPRQTAAVRVDWAVAAGQRLSGGLNWVSSQHPDFANACRMPSYLTADARYAWKVRAVELALGVTNLADRKFYTQAFGCAAGQVTSIYPEAGRAFTASARIQF